MSKKRDQRRASRRKKERKKERIKNNIFDAIADVFKKATDSILVLADAFRSFAEKIQSFGVDKK